MEQSGKSIIFISLEGMAFHAPIGYYDSERIQKNHFIVDVEVGYSLYKSLDGDELSDTINYEIIYEIIKDIMKKPAKLMETPAQQIIQDILKINAELIQSVTVKICKLQPPLPGKVDRSCIKLLYKKG